MKRFAFYQEVRLARPAPENHAYAGRTGVIVGVGDEPGHPLIYGVRLDDEE